MKIETKDFIIKGFIYSFLTIPGLVFAILLWAFSGLLKSMWGLLMSLLTVLLGVLASVFCLIMVLLTSPMGLIHFHRYSYKGLEIPEDAYPFFFIHKSLDIMTDLEKNI